MAPSLLHSLIPLFLVLLALTRISRAEFSVLDSTKQLSVQLATDELDWASSGLSLYSGGVGEIEDENDDGDEDFSASSRRSLFWRRMRYYISYGALAANRVPCPPRSGRSYYTHSCWKARGPVHPYSRGCSAITRCRR